ncbi:hypothetical protein RN001_015764 [Aquatica leii]|uniref:Cytohesin Ubiquitin Protein Inducing domain-containing protein n=1 Tax=Aquatica leii TaxID=1421715 RepID=A0AAN7PXQ2_9COLE|nr:hypothetical protein RN001_015764 [Aquatica leii]
MDNGLNLEEDNCVKMGATGNPNAARLATLQERKQSIEEALAKRNQELRQICIQEAELTGIMPTEIPLEPGESPPIFRRRIGTAFQLPQNLINNLNNEEESISSLELNMQVQANMAEAALSLANESNVSKTVRRQHMAQYQYHKRQYNSLEEKLSFYKARSQMSQQSNSPVLQQQKQKKKPRPTEQDDTVSMNASVQHNEPFGKSVLRHSMRSLQYPLTSDNNMDYRLAPGHQKLAYRSSEGSLHSESHLPLIRPEEAMMSGIYRLSLNGYKTYMERKEINSPHIPSHFISSQSNPNLYHHTSQQYQVASQTLPHNSQRSHQPIQGYVVYPSYNTNIQKAQDYSKFLSNNNSARQSSPTTSQGSAYSKSAYYPPTFYPSCRQYANVDQQFKTLNPHQIQPHQQYEHDVMSVGLGGYWKRTDSGESVWCNSVASDSWQRDKRFGSLDRRRNKRLHKRTSPLVDPKSATVSVVIPYSESARPVPTKPQTANRNRQDSRQLVRTQSLGSVGAQTADSVWPSDDNSSCGSDAHSINEINIAARKQKQKEWFETSLDGPAPLTPTRSHSVMSTTITSSIPSLSPEEKYVEMHTSPVPPTHTHKLPLEIPAESKPQPSPTIPEPNMELFNNNIPKNGTLIQAGQCKPYHEETKPFEMSDFYKYSTKFKKSPIKQENMENVRASPVQRNLSQSFTDENAVIQKGIYQPLQPMKCQPFSTNNNFDRSIDNIGSPTSNNSSLDLSQLTSNVAENFSAEMNAWYQNHEQVENTRTGPHGSSRSTATLV